jgi:predicted enzyme related to lactoylglutathione lyase
MAHRRARTGRLAAPLLGASLLWAPLIGIALMGAPGAAAVQKTVPPSAASGQFVWHDLVTDDLAASRAFYGALFGWTFEAADGVDPGYMMIRHEGRPIGGIVTRRRDGEAAVAQWLAYVAVADVDQATLAFRQAGGRVFRGPLNARKDLRVAVVADAQGAPLGLASRGPALPAEGPPGLHHWLWMEYVARDAAAALSFYGDALGFRHETLEVRQGFTYYLLTTDRPRAGLFTSPWTRETSAWLPYLRVADAAAAAARATELGGTVALPPRPEVRNGSLAIVLDPGGAPIALQKYPFDGGATQ